MARGRPFAIGVVSLLIIAFLTPPISLALDDATGPGHPWPMMGGNPKHTGLSDYSIGEGAKSSSWRVYSSGFRESPVIDSNGTIFVSSSNGVHAMSSDGDIYWQFKASTYVEASPAIGPDGTLYVVTSTRYYDGGGANNLYAINTNGWIEWVYPIGGSGCRGSPVALEDGTIYLGTLGGEVLSLNRNGTLRWSYGSEKSIRTTPAISENGNICFTTNDSMLYCLSENGEFLWNGFFNDTGWSTPTIDGNGMIYLTSSSMVYAVEPNGTEEWTHAINGSTPGVSIDAKGRILASSGGEVHCLDPDGTLNWTSGPLSAERVSVPTIDSDGNVIILTSQPSELNRFVQIKALTSSGEHIWTSDLGHYDLSHRPPSQPAIDREGDIYVVLEGYTVKVEGTSVSHGVILMGIEALIVLSAGVLIYYYWRRKGGRGG